MKPMEQIRTDIQSVYNVCAIDLFCGAGGLTNGLRRAGIDVRLGIDIDPACEFPYKTNNNEAKFLLKSVEGLEPRDIADVFNDGDIRLLAGCAPCQTFSTYNQKATPTDNRWWLLRQFSRLVKEIEPDLVTMENVPGLEEQDVFAEFVQALQDASYNVFHDVVNCENYGVPQHRRRLVLLASKLGPIRMLTPEELGVKRSTVRESISELPSLENGEIDEADPLHRSSKLSPTNLMRIKASRPGGTWRDWDDSLVAECHRKDTGKTYPSVYGRMCWDEAAPTITTQFYGFGNGRFGHPKQDRAISLREGAILQSFPKDYVFVSPGGTVNRKAVGRLIGNAVPVKLAEAIGFSILKHVDSCVRENGYGRYENAIEDYGQRAATQHGTGDDPSTHPASARAAVSFT